VTALPLSGAVLAATEGEGFVAPGSEDFWQPLFGTDGPFAITRASIVLLASVALLSVVLLAVTRKLTTVPSKSQFAAESGYGLVRNSVARDIIGSHDFLRFVPLLFTMFALILVNNLFGVIPFVQFPTMSRIGFPVALTLVVFGIYHYLGIRKHGFVGYHKAMVPPGLPGFIVPFIFFLELVTFYVTRPLTLALRLFANMFAGHLLLLVFILGGEYMLLHGGLGLKFVSVGAFGLGIVMTFFEVLVQFLQAYIFTLLSALYIAGSLADEH
jgi:F-type H+-transporting ATPase subunit a